MIATQPEASTRPPRSPSRRAVCCAAAALAAAAAGLLPTSAAAELRYVRVGTVTDSANLKFAKATCPSGTRVVGAGGVIDNPSAPGQVRLTQVYPTADLTAVQVSARETEGGFGDVGTAASWKVTALAVCTNPPVGLERRLVSSSAASSTRSVLAPCSPGKRVLGTGFDQFAGLDFKDGKGYSNILPTIVAPADNTLTQVLVEAREDEDGETENWAIQAIAICAEPPFGLHRAHALSAASSANKTQNVFCASGFAVRGLGAMVSAGGSEVGIEDLTTTGSSGQAVAVEDETGYSGTWSLRALAVCAE